MPSAIYNEFKFKVDEIPYLSSTIKVMLVDDTYTLDIDAHSNKDDIDALAVEISGTGYTAGGQALTNKSKARDDTNDWAKNDADDAVWGSSTLTARGAIIYNDTGTPATSTLISYADFLSNKASSVGDFVIQWHTTDGVYRLG